MPAGEDLPGGVSNPGAPAGGFQAVPLAEKQGSAGRKEGWGSVCGVLKDILITELPYFKF